MAHMTPQGKVFTVDELINFAKIGSYGVYNNAVGMALQELKRLQAEVAYLRQLRAEVGKEVEDTPESAD